MKILEELWNGQISPITTADYRMEEYQKLVVLLDRNEDRLISTLNQGQRDDLKKIKDVWEEMDSITQCASFITGFRLAVQLMAASL